MKNSMKRTAFSFQLSAFSKSVRRFVLHFLKPESRQPTAGNRGFTLLLAALVASIVLALGTSIFQLAQKELTLSSIGRDSQFAFYAADTGAECALYWDVRHQSFPTSPSRTADISCDNQDKTTTVTTSGDGIISTFQFAPNGYCVNVSVNKSTNVDTGDVATTVHADGFSTHVTDPNTCTAAIKADRRALQRSVELKY